MLIKIVSVDPKSDSEPSQKVNPGVTIHISSDSTKFYSKIINSNNIKNR